MKPYFVLRCEGTNGTVTWDVVRRESDVKRMTVASHKTRQSARTDATARNTRSASRNGMISQRMDDTCDGIDKALSDLQRLLYSSA